MSTRVILSACAIGAALAGGSAGAQTTLTVANGWAPKHVVSTQGVEPWMECVRKADASVGFNYFPSGQIATTKDMLNALNNGVADLSIIPMGYVTSKMPLNGASLLPDLGSRASAVTPAYAKAVRSGLLAQEFADNRIQPIWVIVFPAYQLMSRGEPLRSQADFKGKVIRSSGGAMNLTVSAIGASAAEIPSSDLYVALDRGTVDGGLSALASIKPYKLNEVIRAVSTNGEFGSFSLTFAADKADWDKLTDAQRKVMTECGEKVQAAFAAHLDAETDQLGAEFAKAGVKVYEFSPQELTWINAQLESVSKDWVDRLAARSLPAAQALADYRKLVKGR